jgi:hypothetical protein
VFLEMQCDLEALFGIHGVENKIKNEKCNFPMY